MTQHHPDNASLAPGIATKDVDLLALDKQLIKDLEPIDGDYLRTGAAGKTTITSGGTYTIVTK